MVAQGRKAAEVDDNVSKIVDLIIAQSNDLWPLSLALLATAFLMVVSPVESGRRPRTMTLSLWGVVLLSTLSLIFGYLVKGALIGDVDQLMTPDGKWSLGSVETLSFWQGVFTLAAALLLAAIFWFCKGAATQALSGIWRK
jgi:hypothetical protein